MQISRGRDSYGVFPNVSCPSTSPVGWLERRPDIIKWVNQQLAWFHAYATAGLKQPRTEAGRKLQTELDRLFWQLISALGVIVEQPEEWDTAQAAQALAELSRVDPPVSRVYPPVSRVDPPVSRVEPQSSRVEQSVRRVEPPISRVEESVRRVKPSVSRVEPSVSRDAPAAQLAPLLATC